MAHLGNTIINGALRVLGGEYVDTINGVTVGDSPKFTDTNNAVTQTATSTSANYEILFSATADNTTRTEGARKNTNLTFNPNTGAFYSEGFNRINITAETLDLDTLTLKETGSPHAKYYIEKTDSGAANITNRPVTANNPFLLDVEAIRINSTSDFITRQTYRNAANPTNEYVRFCTNGTWGAWTTRVFTDTTYSVVSSSDNGLAPKVTDTLKFLKGDGTWATPTDTKNTAGSTDSSSKLFLIGATSQADNPQTYSHDTAYVGTDGCLYSGGTKVLTAHQTIKQDGVTGATVNRFGTCSTAAGTAAKTVDITTGTFALEAGSTVAVKFTNANTANSPTLNVNSKGAKNIFVNGAQITSGGNKALLTGTVIFVYDGTQWNLVGNYYDTNTQTVTGVKGDSESSYRTGNVNITCANIGAATSDHTHTATIAADSGTSSLSMTANTKYKLTAGGSTFVFTTPPDNNTWTALVGATSSANGSVGYINATPPKDGYNTKYFRADGTWVVPPNDDTKNTAGSTDTSSKIFLVGATSQAANPQTYSDDQVYVTSGTLTSAKTDTKAIVARTGSGTAGSDQGADVSPRYIPTLWTFNAGITVANGEVYFIKIPQAGGTFGVWCSLDNGTNYYPVAVSSGKARFTTHYAKNTVIAVTYESAGKCTCYAKDGADTTADVTGIFRVLNDYDANTTYSAMSSSELTTGTATTSRVVRADYLKTGINSLIDTKIGATSIATSSGTNQLTLAASTKYAITAGGTSYIFTTPPDTDTKVTSADNHYAPATVSGQDKTASATGATAAWSIDVVKGVTLNTDGKGHVTGLSVTSGKIPANPNTDTKVRQTLSTTNKNYPLLMSYAETSSTTGNIDNVSYRANTIYANPSTGNIQAAKFNGVATYYSSAVSAAVGDTTCTITNSNITTNSMIEPFSSNSSGNTIAIKNMAVTAGQVVLTFKDLTEATSFKVRITN